MWECKCCEDGNIIGNVKGSIPSGWGYPDEDGNISKLENKEEDWGIVSYECDSCGIYSKDIEEIAIWVD
ncbi:hypothetical protein [Fusobacterium ulcerans]|uniref:hypothetical protein n=1 Tax=Fusobacterium ulcerans TaxID=861 RepID=UPI0030A5FC08